MNSALIRYNFRVVMFNNWWILVFPVAVSQLTVFWNIISQKFSPALPVTSAELVTPLLAAFLAAHILAAEYPARVGSILASKPLNIGKLVLLRLAGGLALVWILELISLAAYYFGMEHFAVGTSFLVSVPSTLFLALLAITFATLLRHPMAGFAVAALYWALQLPLGPPINSYLSIRSYSTFVATGAQFSTALTEQWWISKALLLAGAMLLYIVHSRLVFRLGVPATQRARRRAVAAAGALLASYIAGGACVKVAYGYAHRGSLQPNDGAWFRQQFASFGPLPVTYLFGPAFRGYVGEVPNAWRLQFEGDSDMLGDSLKHRQDLKNVVDKMPGSVWAPSAADLFARLVRRDMTVDARTAAFQHIADTYPDSPYVQHALREKAQSFDVAELRDKARDAYEDLLERCPATIYRSEAQRYIMEVEHTNHNLAAAEKWAREWQKSAPLQEAFLAWVELAKILKENGDASAAKEAAHNALQAVRTFRTALQEDRLAGTPTQQMKWDRQSREAESAARTY